jgi:hypothetical protein
VTLHDDVTRLNEAGAALWRAIVKALRLDALVGWLNERLTR